jgi:hypothetical protein
VKLFALLLVHFQLGRSLFDLALQGVDKLLLLSPALLR